MKKYEFPMAFDYLGVQVVIDYDDNNYTYIANYTNGIEKVRNEYYSIDDALNDVKRSIESKL